MALKGDVGNLKRFRKALAQLPLTVSAGIAAGAAPEVSALARSAFDGGRTVYGTNRPRGVDGNALDLVRTGASRAAVRFDATGTQMRTPVLPRYTKYLIGLYSILPSGRLPVAWQERLRAIAGAVIQASLGTEPPK